MQNTNELKEINGLLDFIDKSQSTYHVVENLKNKLIIQNYKELNLSEKWDIEKNQKYFIIYNNSAIIAFNIGNENISKTGFRIIASHTDSPSIKIKPNPEIGFENNYIKLNTEVYGGVILNTWFDRPLSIAGRVVLKSDNVFNPKSLLVAINRPLMIIPNVAIHLNREINEGSKINKQNHLQPILSSINSNLEKENFLLNLIANELKINATEILDFDLQLFETHKSELLGANNEFISAGKLDNLAMAYSSFEAFINSENKNATNVFLCFDNEEVGSQTKQGAGSPFLRNILERIVLKLENDKESFFQTIFNSFVISADMAHAVHPNYSEYHDPTNRPFLNKGVVIKYNANQKYTTDAISAAIFERICENANVKFQKYVNKSDVLGGSTLGCILTSQLEVKSVDIGNPLLAMHSIRELCGVNDYIDIVKVFKEFYKNI